MKTITCTILTAIVLLSSSFLFSQEKSGVEEREKFISKYSRTIGANNVKELKRFIEDEFTPLLLDLNAFPGEIFLEMKSTIQVIEDKNIKPFPHLHNYVLSVYSLVNRGKTGKQFEQWHTITEDLLDNRNPRRVQDFLAVSKSFLYEDIITRDPNIVWYAKAQNFEFFVEKTPAIRLKNASIIGKTLNKGRDKDEIPFTDSIKIVSTDGVVNLTREKWEGKGGKFNWEKAGLPENETSAELSNYSVSFRSALFSADSVTLKTPYIDEPVFGRIVDRAVKGNYKEDRTKDYPQFNSYEANLEIDNIIEDVDYEGGFSLNGNQFIGIGNDEKQAELVYHRNNKPFIKSYSDRVQVSSERIKTNMAGLILLIGMKDSITHTRLDITYDIKKKTMKMVRGNTAISQAPFVNTFHKLNMYVDEIVWNKESEDLILGYNMNTSEQQRIAKFESFSYYDERLYQNLQGLETIHPLVALYNYAYKYDKFNMDEGTAATALKRTIQQAKPKLLELSVLGFISYDTERGTVKITPKTEHFVKSKSRKNDYDN